MSVVRDGAISLSSGTTSLRMGRGPALLLNCAVSGSPVIPVKSGAGSIQSSCMVSLAPSGNMAKDVNTDPSYLTIFNCNFDIAITLLITFQVLNLVIYCPVSKIFFRSSMEASMTIIFVWYRLENQHHMVDANVCFFLKPNLNHKYSSF